MSEYSKEFSNYRTINYLFLVIFTILFFFAPSICFSWRSDPLLIASSSTTNGWSIFKLVIDNINNLNEAFDEHNLLGLGCLFYLIIPAMIGIVFVRLLTGNIYNQKLILCFVALIGVPVALYMMEIVKPEFFKGVKLEIGLWGSAVTAIIWYLYNKRNEPARATEDTAKSVEKEPAPVVNIPDATQSEVNANGPSAVVENNEVETTAGGRDSEEVLRMTGRMSDAELQGVIKFFQIYDAVFVEAARAELARRQSVK